MAKGFFRELKHYKLYDISKELNTQSEETKRLVGILKKYGIVKAVKASKTDYKELSNQDIILTDVVENADNLEYVFDFVGVVMIEQYVFKCYPKYISSAEKIVEKLKQVLKVIKKYNDKEQLIYLYNGEDDNKIFNQLAVSLHLLEDYFQYGLYTNQQDIIEVNGEGEILWDKTINETFALIQNNRPYYVELQTQNTVDNEMDYFRRLHECVISKCSVELKDTGILELFDIAEAELTSAKLSDFGEIDYIKYRLEREIQSQFITRKQILLKTIYTYIANERANQQDLSFSLYGTNSFNLVWEDVCSENFGNMLDFPLKKLPTQLSDVYQSKKDKKLIDIIEKPIWWKYQDDKNIKAIPNKTLKPDLITIYPCLKDTYCFGIFDAKYYCVNIEYDDTAKKGFVNGQMGVGDITKQYLYQLAYKDFIKEQGYEYVQNIFLCPQEDKSIKYGYVEMNMLHSIGNGELENITLVKLCAAEMYDFYLNGAVIEDIQSYLPMELNKQIYGKSFSDKMFAYLRETTKLSSNTVAMQMGSGRGNLIYPESIKKELGAKLIYDTICPFVVRAYDNFEPCEKEDAGDSLKRCEEIAEAALEVENQIKKLTEEQLQDKQIIRDVFRNCFVEKEKIDAVISGKLFDELVEQVVKLIREVYL